MTDLGSILSSPLYALGQKWPGRLEPGNLDLNARQVYHGAPRDQPYDNIRTENSMSFEDDGSEVLIPTVVGGVQLSPDAAIEHYYKTGEHLGKFASPAAADGYAEQLHERQARKYGKPE